MHKLVGSWYQKNAPSNFFLKKGGLIMKIKVLILLMAFIVVLACAGCASASGDSDNAGSDDPVEEFVLPEGWPDDFPYMEGLVIDQNTVSDSGSRIMIGEHPGTLDEIWDFYADPGNVSGIDITSSASGTTQAQMETREMYTRYDGGYFTVSLEEKESGCIVRFIFETPSE